MQIHLTKIFLSNPDRYEGVRPISIYVMRLVFLLAFLIVGKDSWTNIIMHQGAWTPLDSVAFCMWAGYSTLSILGVFYTLKMLPLMLFLVFYKVIWLGAVAYPLWISNQLVGSPVEGLTHVFLWVILPLVSMPWGYVFTKYFRN